MSRNGSVATVALGAGAQAWLRCPMYKPTVCIRHGSAMTLLPLSTLLCTLALYTSTSTCTQAAEMTALACSVDTDLEVPYACTLQMKERETVPHLNQNTHWQFMEHNPHHDHHRHPTVQGPKLKWKQKIGPGSILSILRTQHLKTICFCLNLLTQALLKWAEHRIQR